MKIEVVGSILGQTGYDSHTRQLCNALYNEGIDIALTTNLPADWVRHVNDNELKMITNSKDKLDYRMLITLPSIAPLYWNDGVPIIQYVVWEGDRIPKSWINILSDKRIKYIIVPSNHTRSAILETIDMNQELYHIDINDKIKIIPHGVNIDIFKPDKERILYEK